ncbi:T9SS type A sorting domain-containing protein [Lewinella sp. LCG006]|uniref:T9SS type A sorting domain-containing protein n=1 Tax=Lewinella sp. LCG006 TaxID=3231911 RepID=UPI00345FF34D
MRLFCTSFALLLCGLSLNAQIIEKPLGCFAGTNGTNSNVISHPDARGVLLTEKWSNIESTPGVIDFTLLDNKINIVKSAGLKYAIAISVGAFGSPAWLTGTLGADHFDFEYQGQNWVLPLWWDAIVEERLDALISALGEQYASDTLLSHVYVSQMTVNGIEGHLNGVDMAAFALSGFSNEQWIACAKATALKFGEAFPSKPIVFEIHEIDRDTIVPATIINDLVNEESLCERIGLGMWWISGKTSYQPDLITYISNFQGDKYAQVIGRSDQVERFQDGLYSTVFTQAKMLGIRYLEPWPYEFQNHTYDSLLQDFNSWTDLNFSPSDTCAVLSGVVFSSQGSQGITIYPNPTSGYLFLKTTAITETEISVYNATGRMVIPPTIQKELNMTHLPKGVYFVAIKTRDSTIIKKILKTN